MELNNYSRSHIQKKKLLLTPSGKKPFTNLTSRFKTYNPEDTSVLNSGLKARVETLTYSAQKLQPNHQSREPILKLTFDTPKNQSVRIPSSNKTMYDDLFFKAMRLQNKQMEQQNLRLIQETRFMQKQHMDFASLMKERVKRYQDTLIALNEECDYYRGLVQQNKEIPEKSLKDSSQQQKGANPMEALDVAGDKTDVTLDQKQEKIDVLVREVRDQSSESTYKPTSDAEQLQLQQEIKQLRKVVQRLQEQLKSRQKQQLISDTVHEQEIHKLQCNVQNYKNQLREQKAAFQIQMRLQDEQNKRLTRTLQSRHILKINKQIQTINAVLEDDSIRVVTHLEIGQTPIQQRATTCCSIQTDPLLSSDCGIQTCQLSVCNVETSTQKTQSQQDHWQEPKVKSDEQSSILVLQDSLRKLNWQRHQIMVQCQSLTTELNMVKVEIGEYKLKLSTLEIQLQKQRQQLRRFASEIVQIHKQQVGTLKTQLRMQEQNHSAANSQLSDLVAQTCKRQQQMLLIYSKNAALSSELQHKIALCQKLQQLKSNLQDQLLSERSQLLNKISDMEVQNQTLHAQIKTLLKDHQNLVVDIDRVQLLFDGSAHQLEEARQELQKLQTEDNNKESYIQGLVRQISDKQKEIDRQANTPCQECRQLTDQLIDTRKQMMAKLRDAEEENQMLKGEVRQRSRTNF